MHAIVVVMALRNFTDSFAVYRKHQLKFISAALVFIISDLIITGAVLGILMLTFMTLLLAGIIDNVISVYILSAIAVVLAIVLMCFLNSLRAGFYDSCYAIYLARRQTPVDFLSYSMHRFPTYVMHTLVQLFIFALVLVPIIALNFFVPNDILRYVSVLLVLLASTITSAPFVLATTAVVVDNVGWLEALGRATRTLSANLLPFVLMVIVASVLQTVALFIPIVGVLLVLFVLLPVCDSAFVMFYRSRRK